MKKDRKIFALGFFDGVHRGHQALLKACCRLAEKSNLQTAAITFLQHPLSLFCPQPPALINTVADRERLLHQFGINEVYKLPVTDDIMSTHWQVFLENLLEKGAAGFVCGYDFRFGHRGEGNAEKLSAFCRERELPCIIVPEQSENGIRISSTYIRSLIEAGEMEKAVHFLGHAHIFTGTVIPGRQLGRTFGIPTANFLIPNGVVVPKFGVYACKTWVDGREYMAVTNVGTRPTVNGDHITVEAWLLDFEGDLYGRELTLEFYTFLRPEKKFPSLDALQEKIRKNAAQTRKILEKS